MSIKVMNWVWGSSRSRNGARLVMLALADRADGNGLAWPSIEDLAERTRLSPRAVQKGVNALVELGELKVECGGGRHRRNRYQIIPNPRTSDGVTGQEPRTSDGVSPEETPHFAPETPNSATETPHFAPENPVQSSPEPPLEPPGEPPGNQPPTPIADQMFNRWWDQFGRRTAQSKRNVRRAIADALDNGNDPDELWSALLRLGELSKPVTGGTLQFAFSEIRPRTALPASPSGNVVQLSTGLPLVGTDAKVAAHAALTAQLRAQEERETS